jgi:SHS2 domain-containing protein
MSFKFIDHPADIAVEVIGKSLEELFIDSAMAWQHSVIDEKIHSSTKTKTIVFVNQSLEILLVNFLNELNYLLFSKKWIMNSIKEIKISKKESVWNLKVKIRGEGYSPLKHSLKEEIKAITFHQMNIKEKKGEYVTRIVFDI